jgi:stage II sporulation protein D
MRLAACCVLALTFASTAAAAERAFLVSGRGWGHGIGMSQWGAEGLALHGWSYRGILGHYYPGTTLVRERGGTIRVLLAEGRARVVVSSTTPFRVVSRGRTRVLRAGRHAVPGRRLRPPLRFEPGATPLALDGSGYRGDLVVTGRRGSLQVVDDVSVERYLRGVVPAEMPFYWRVGALEAQAVAARSYALSQRKPAQSFDVYADARDQVYEGIRGERAWTNRAVGATAGEVLTWNGQVALTYYCSTSGGLTEAVSDAIPGVAQVPYLVSVADPYDSISPKHRWGPIRLDARQLTSKLDVPDVTRLALSLNGSDRVAWVQVAWHGGAKRVTGKSFQQAFGLPSTWFTVRGAEVDGGATGAAVGSGGDWPAGRSGWTVVLSSLPASAGEPAARAAATKATKAGAPAVGVLDSSAFSTLQPGFFVVFSGVYATEARATAAAHSLAARFPAAYPRHITP